VPTYVFLAVLAAAACHAGWNSILKLKLTPFTSLTLINIASALVVLPFVALVPFPGADAWPYLIASLVIHLAYYIGLTEAYRTGDMGQVYPIARGAGTLLSALIAYFSFGEDPGQLGWIGIIVLATGIGMLSFAGQRARGRIDFRAIVFALLTAIAIASYTVVDGVGARLAVSAASYIVWLFLLDGIMMLVVGVGLIGARRLVDDFRSTWVMIILGGMLAMLSYGTAIWAMTLAPIALVAAVRETSVVFAAILGVVVLKEPIIASRLLAAAIVLVGLIVMRLG
jgi:drug/metabolite transporter (DMT)-like permease